MMARRGMLGLLAGGASFALSGCGLIFSSGRLRHRIAVEVETPAGVRTGSSVIETTARESSTWGGNGPGVHFEMTGEAVAVDLPDGQTLFALLRGADGSQGDGAGFQARLMTDAVRAGARANPPLDLTAKDLMLARAAVKDAELSLELPQTLYPMLVRFRDIKDPKSVEQVDPANLAGSFGAGERLKRIMVNVTDDAVTTGIGERLEWLGKHYNTMLNGDEIEWMNKPELAAHLSSGSFSNMRRGR